jgi:hypothetical protein
MRLPHRIAARFGSPDDRPTQKLSTMGETYRYGEELPVRRRLADPVGLLARLPSEYRRWTAASLLLATAEMNVIARYEGRPWWVLVLGMVLRAPLHAAVAAALLFLLGRLTHATARVLGGTGYRDVTTEAIVVFAAVMALPAGIALLLAGRNGDFVTVLEVLLSVAALVIGVRMVARLEALEISRAATALVIPVLLVMVLLIALVVLETLLLPDSWLT